MLASIGSGWGTSAIPNPLAPASRSFGSIFGPGYRVYFGREGSFVVILLCGGSKRAQVKNILTAQKYWKEYLDAKNNN